MKKYRYLFLVFLTAIMSGLYLISCGGDGDGDSGNGGSGDGGQGSTTSSIIGTWEMSISGSVEHTVMLCANGIGYFLTKNLMILISINLNTSIIKKQKKSTLSFGMVKQKYMKLKPLETTK